LWEIKNVSEHEAINMATARRIQYMKVQRRLNRMNGIITRVYFNKLQL